jgi:serine/threonine protein kinase
MILKQMYDLLGPWPLSLADIITDPKDQEAIQYSMAHGRPRSPIARWPKQCMPFADGKFLKRIMKLDPRDRPTVEEILKDEWFTEGSEDTRIPMPPQPTLSEDNASSEALKHSRWIVNQFNLDRFDQRDLFNLI